ncbi:MAG: Ribonuclease [Verrucomicrobiales bacterium]|nr:Ribonuclease [Verrucomicrobiales bacterium]
MAEKSGSRVRKLYTTAYEFITEKGIESEGEATTSKIQRFAQFWLLAIKSFYRNKGPLRATALAYTTLFSLVPILAIAAGVTATVLKETGTTKQLLYRLVDTVAPQLQLMPKPAGQEMDLRQQLVDNVDKFINNVQPKTLGITGMVGLIIVAILLLTNIENTFNDIWGITQGRSWFKRVVQYWATISLGPIVLTVIIVLVANLNTSELSVVPYIGQKILPFFVVSCAFALFYKLMPNTEVHWNAAAVGGLVGGSLWLLLNIANALNMSRVVSMSAIYGSALAVLPIFLLGLYFSWLILLFGAQVSYAYQNRQVYVQEKQAENVSQKAREYVALRIMTLLAQRFGGGFKPPTLLEIGTELGVPTRLVGRIVQPLIEAQLAVEIGGKEVAYAPARPIETITCEDVIEVLRIKNGRDLATKDEPARSIVCAEFDRIRAAERHAAESVTLKELVDKIPFPVGAVEPTPTGTAFWRKKAS